MLKVNKIFASYGKFDVLRGVSLYVDKNEIVSIIGPNGAGKSTVLRCISGFLKPRLGEIYFNGENIVGLSPVEIMKKGILHVFQRRSIFPKMTVLENLEMGAYIRNDKEQIKKDIKAIFEIFPILKERMKKKANTLSGGEQRMLEIARALLVHPKILLLDEPSLGLAPKVLDMIFKKIKELNEMGITIVIVEQNAKKALEISDRAYVLALGQNVLEGKPKEIIENSEIRKLYLGG
jgi:branched-chain amino acid transport system ATP-binding protein